MNYSYTWAVVLGLLTATKTSHAQTAASFAPVVTYSTGSGSNPSGIAAADVNGDGKPDLLTANFSTNSAGVLLNTGSGIFGPVSIFSNGSGGYNRTSNIAAADVNRDGKLDLITANYNGDTVGILLGTGTGSFGAATVLSAGAGSYPTDIVVTDVNGDGKLDLITANYGSGTTGVLLGTGVGSFGTVVTFNAGSRYPAALAIADVNNDGNPDVVTANSLDSNVGVLLGTGIGSFAAATVYNAGSNSTPYGVAIADVNGDGKPDLLTANGGNMVGVLLGTGTGSFGPVSTYSTSSGTHGIVVADVNGDGKLDLLTANNSDAVGVLLGTGTGSFGGAMTVSIGAGSQPRDLAVADVNGDRRPDLLTANNVNHTVGVLLNTGTYTPLTAATGLDAATVALYPNPASGGRVQVAVPAVAGAATVQATLLDALGRVVRQQSAVLPAAGTTLTLDTAGLAAGVYILRLQAGSSVLARRVALN